ncbi:MAG: hypothetical protein HY927_01710 [Elusimicrobia bacterium]|nr:hypothetical protein [Elusimicrobiota bacterium]
MRRAAAVALTALALWPLLAKAFELRDLVRSEASLRCLANLAALAGTLDGGGSLCPRTGRPYRIGAVPGGRVFFCDDPARHLRIPVRFLRTGSITQVRMDLPAFTATPGSRELASTNYRATLRLRPDAVSIHLETKPWQRYLFMPIVAVAGAVLFLTSSHFAIDATSRTRSELVEAGGTALPEAARRGALPRIEFAEAGPPAAGAPGAWVPVALRGMGHLALWTACMAVGTVLFAAGLRGSVYSREITVLPEAAAIRFQDLIFEKAWTKPATLDDVQAVVPVPFGRRHYRLHAIHAADGRVGRRFLFTVGESEAGLAGLLNRPPVFNRP